MEKYDVKDGVWRTVGGRRIFIKNGQDLASAMKESGKFKSKKISRGVTEDEYVGQDGKVHKMLTYEYPEDRNEYHKYLMRKYGTFKEEDIKEKTGKQYKELRNEFYQHEDDEYKLYTRAKENPDSIDPMTENSTDWESLDKKFKGRYEKEKGNEDIKKSMQKVAKQYEQDKKEGKVAEKLAETEKNEKEIRKQAEEPTRVRSTKKEVVDKIQKHIRDYYENDEDLIRDMDAGADPRYDLTPWKKGERMVESGNMLIANSDMNDEINSWGINPQGKEYDSQKSYETYKSLVGREMGKMYEQAKDRLGKEYRGTINQMNKDDSKPANATYDIETGKPVEFKKGYSVSFEQSSDNYTNSEYYDRIAECRDKCDGKVYFGKFGGNPEASFYTEDKETAFKIMEKYNQHSIYDYELGDIITNPKYNESTNKVNVESKSSSDWARNAFEKYKSEHPNTKMNLSDFIRKNKE